MAHSASIRGHTNEKATADELGVGLRTLRKWRQQGLGPPYTKVGRQIFYNDDSRAAWIRSREVQPIRAKDAA